MILGWLRRFLGIDPPLPVGPRPTGWNKTLTELSAENRSLSREEMEWGREYELVQLRSWARFPRDNEEFEAKQDKKVSFAIWWKAPYTTGGEGVLPKGTRIRVSVHPQDPEPIGVQVQPVETKAFEELLVPEIDRRNEKYAGYSIWLTVAELNREFDRVGDPAMPKDTG